MKEHIKYPSSMVVPTLATKTMQLRVYMYDCIYYHTLSFLAVVFSYEFIALLASHQLSHVMYAKPVMVMRENKAMTSCNSTSDISINSISIYQRS